MRQTSLVLVQRSQAISFTFIGGSEDEVNELIERLSFASRKPTRWSPRTFASVMLSEAESSIRELSAQSKDPYSERCSGVVGDLHCAGKAL